MKYVALEKNIVTQIILEFDKNFPNVPISDRYNADFLRGCVVVLDDIPCFENWVYDEGTNSFFAPSAPSPSFTLDEAIAFKTLEINQACENAIVAGFDYNGSHYSLTTNDQANILAWSGLAQTGKSVPYHADLEECRVYSALEFMGLAATATAFKAKHTTYCNLLKMQVRAMETLADVYAVRYDVTTLNGLDGEFLERYNVVMGALS